MLSEIKYAIARKVRDYSENQIDNDFERLKRLPSVFSTQSSLAGLKFVDFFTFPERLNCKGKRGLSFYDVYLNRNNLTTPYIERFILSEKINHPKNNEQKLWYSIFRQNYGSINTMRPSVARYIFGKYKAKKILDPCAGWGSRLVAAMSLPETTYIGIDTNIDLLPYYTFLINKLQAQDRTNMIWNDASQVDFSLIKYDFVFTSPPYYNLEKYNHMPDYPTREEFNQRFWFPLLKKLVKNIAKGGIIALNIPAQMYLDTVPILGEATESVPMFKSAKQYKRENPDKYIEQIYIWISSYE